MSNVRGVMFYVATAYWRRWQVAAVLGRSRPRHRISLWLRHLTYPTAGRTQIDLDVAAFGEAEDGAGEESEDEEGAADEAEGATVGTHLAANVAEDHQGAEADDDG